LIDDSTDNLSDKNTTLFVSYSSFNVLGDTQFGYWQVSAELGTEQHGRQFQQWFCDQWKHSHGRWQYKEKY